MSGVRRLVLALGALLVALISLHLLVKNPMANGFTQTLHSLQLLPSESLFGDAEALTA